MSSPRPSANDSISASPELLKGRTATHSSSLRPPTADAVCSLACRSFSGTSELPSSLLYRLKTWTRTPCFTSTSPRSCNCGCQCPYCSRSSATRFDNKMCPASPQSITRWATLIPMPAAFVRSFRSVTVLTGPLCTPMRTRNSGYVFSARLISSAHSTGCAGLL